MTKPISPDEIASTLKNVIPDDVFEVFNELIATNYDGQSAKVYQDDVLAHLTSSRFNFDRSEIFAKGWLNVEEAYRDSGWKVYYDRPSFNESYRAYFEFKRAK